MNHAYGFDGQSVPPVTNPTVVINRIELEEPIMQTVMKDVKSVILKTRYAIFPFSLKEKEEKLRDCNTRVMLGDLWGPLIFCLLMSTFISLSSSAVDDSDDVFGIVYLTLFGGAAIIGINTFLVSEVSSIFLMMSIIGYCLFPFVVASLAEWLLRDTIGFIGVDLN